QKGFTLIETLIVLIIMTVILSFSMMSLHSFINYIEKKLFIDQIQSDIYYSHSIAISQKETVVVRFTRTGSRYEIVKGSTGELILEKRLPNSISIESSTLPAFTITPDGTVSNFGKIVFRQKDKRFELAFSIGRGRFHIKE